MDRDLQVPATVVPTHQEKGFGEEAMTQKDIRFCPYCCMMEFEIEKEGRSVHCDLCGVEILVQDLVKSTE